MSLMRVLFPIPVSPTTAVRVPGRKSWLKPSMVFLVASAYVKSTSLKRTPTCPSSLIGSPLSSCGSSSSQSRSTDATVWTAVANCLDMREIGLWICPTSWRKAAMVPNVMVPAAMPVTPHEKAVM